MRVRFMAGNVKLCQPGRGTMHNIRTLRVYEDGSSSEVEIGMNRTLLIDLKKQIEKELEETTE